MSRKLDDLAPTFRPQAVEFLARLTEAAIPVMIVDTLRTAGEQAAYLANGTSWVQHSKHQDGLAMDVCPYGQYALHGADKLQWDASDPVWGKIATIAETIGLRSGYRWKQKDCGHVELPTQAVPTH